MCRSATLKAVGLLCSVVDPNGSGTRSPALSAEFASNASSEAGRGVVPLGNLGESPRASQAKLCPGGLAASLDRAGPRPGPVPATGNAATVRSHGRTSVKPELQGIGQEWPRS